MTLDQYLMKYTATCDHCRLENWFCYDCAKSAIAAAVEEEREACAKAADNIEGWTSEIHEHDQSIAAAIRARGEGG